MTENGKKHFVPEAEHKPGYGEQARDYPEYLKQFYDTLLGDLRFVPREIHCGPVYHIKTSKGVDARVLTYYRDRQNPNPARGNFRKCRHTYLIAADDSGEVLGNRMMDSNYYLPGENVNTIETSGRIATRYRGLGLSTAIDLVNREMLQNEVNRTGGRLRWGILNSNARALANLKYPRPRIPGLVREETTQAEREMDIREKEGEQGRWQSVYGELGKFGAISSINRSDDEYEIYLERTQPPQDLEKTDEVWLDRDLDEDRFEVEIKRASLIPEGREQPGKKKNLRN